MAGNQTSGLGKHLAARLATEPLISPKPPPARAGVLNMTPGSRPIGSLAQPDCNAQAEPVRPSEKDNSDIKPHCSVLDAPERSVTSPAVMGSIVASVAVMGAILWFWMHRSNPDSLNAVDRTIQKWTSRAERTDADLPYITADPVPLPALIESVEEGRHEGQSVEQIVLGAPEGNEWPSEIEPRSSRRR